MYTLTKADMLAQLAGLQQEIHQLHRSARQDRRHFSRWNGASAACRPLTICRSCRPIAASWKTIAR